MGKIIVGIFDEHFIVCEGIQSLLEENEDIRVAFSCSEKNKLQETIKNTPVNILIFNLHTISTVYIDLIMQIDINFQRTKILVISVLNNEEIILKVIKSGAKGFLSKDSNRYELTEAILTLRNGHDYYSKSITDLLLGKYIVKIKTEDNTNTPDINLLSTRQIEILKLWGESYSNQEIADKLFISIRTVETHKNHIMNKLNLKTTVDMVKYAIKNNIIEI